MQNKSKAKGSRNATIFGLLVLLVFMLAGLLLSNQIVALSPQSNGDELRKSDSTGVVNYLNLLSRSPEVTDQSLAMIDANWHPGSTAMLVEVSRFVPSRATLAKTFAVLESKTGQKFGPDLDAWHQWIWSQESDPHPGYAVFKSRLYSRIDPRFAEYFVDADKLNIRLDQIQWGGVRRDGIPPLKDPKMLAASDADYLSDSDVVFGIDLGGDARCYPKRILAWHEMFKDTIGGESVCGVYWTLCGALIVYQTELDGKHYELGTSGFLYRSSKLMYDHETKSFWSTLQGAPVVGALVGKDISLKQRYVVTTTWGQWKKRHPDTTVLSLDTGHRRDYGEGVAYKNYFATDELMFKVPGQDKRLLNKDSVVALRDENSQLAISAKFLAKNRVYSDKLSDQDFVVLTNGAGANRVYDSEGTVFKSYDGENIATDDTGTKWTVNESELTAGTKSLSRLPAHRVFWFGWSSQFPDTRLVK